MTCKKRSGQAGGVIAGFVTAVELSGKRTKAFFGIMVQTPFALGEALVAAIAIGVRDWRTYQVSPRRISATSSKSITSVARS